MGDNIHILVIDDEISIRESLAEFLEDYDFVVKTVETAEEALEILGRKRFDIGVVDVRLPGMNGDQFVLTAAPLYPDMRFLFHTGSADFTLNPQLEKLGLTNDHILRKPLENMSHVAKMIKQLTAKL